MTEVRTREDYRRKHIFPVLFKAPPHRPSLPDGGIPSQRLAESFGRSARELCDRLEVLGVVERIRTTRVAAAVIG